MLPPLIGGARRPGAPRISSPPNLVVVEFDDRGWQDDSIPMGTETTVPKLRDCTPIFGRFEERTVVLTNAFVGSRARAPIGAAYPTDRNTARTGITYWTLLKD